MLPNKYQLKTIVVMMVMYETVARFVVIKRENKAERKTKQNFINLTALIFLLAYVCVAEIAGMAVIGTCVFIALTLCE